RGCGGSDRRAGASRPALGGTPRDRSRDVPRARHGHRTRASDGLRAARTVAARGARRRRSRRCRRNRVMRFSIVIAPYGRADTRPSLDRLRPAASWEVIVVDNNSPDDTRAIVDASVATFPAPLRYAFERQQGRSAALNHGFRIAAGDILVTTDDDVRVEPAWL